MGLIHIWVFCLIYLVGLVSLIHTVSGFWGLPNFDGPKLIDRSLCNVFENETNKVETLGTK